jgi:lipopolysaccharide/colanic/teichoic acid biosynthesis glycosyltransferase
LGRQFSDALTRCLDILLSGLAIIFFAPLALVIVCAILIEDGRPVFCAREHRGHKAAFARLSFRTRTVRPPHGLSRVGGLLTDAGLHCLPALINVWRGHMSLVGPPSCPTGMLYRYPRLAKWLDGAKPGLWDAGLLLPQPRAAAIDRLYRRTRSVVVYLLVVSHAVHLLVLAEPYDRLSRSHTWR